MFRLLCSVLDILLDEAGCRLFGGGGGVMVVDLKENPGKGVSAPRNRFSLLASLLFDVICSCLVTAAAMIVCVLRACYLYLSPVGLGWVFFFFPNDVGVHHRMEPSLT